MCAAIQDSVTKEKHPSFYMLLCMHLTKLYQFLNYKLPSSFYHDLAT